jgi:UDP-N-acetylglucosamine:LPS N-acetylglucosamine transferase
MFTVLFLTRGSGMGHAARDMLVAQELKRLRPDAEIRFASYADGVKALRMHGIDVIDLMLPPMGNIHERIPRIGKLLREHAPALVVSDEELFALPLCHVFDIPAVFITNWLATEETVSYISLLLNAERIIVTDIEDSFMPPVWLEKLVEFVGPVCRLEAITEDKRSLRQQLGLDPNRRLVLITAGGSDVSDVVYFGMCAYALARIKEPLQVIAVAGPWYKMLEPMQYAWTTSIQFTDYIPQLTRYIAASDFVLTRGGHSTLWELALHGIPSICIPHPRLVDPLNEYYAFTMQRRGTTIVLPERELNVEMLLAKCENLLQDKATYQSMSQTGLTYRERVGTRKAAEAIASYLPS